ncbi:MAG: glutathione S-transferase [Pseudomonadota bacterium]
MALPVLYSFRRCPYAMRARLAIASAGYRCELREIVLRDKAPEFVEASPKATVPVLVTAEGLVVEESLDVMQLVLGEHDPENWLTPQQGDLQAMHRLIAECDGPFKRALDRYKYSTRYEDADPRAEREAGAAFLRKLDARLEGHAFLFGDVVSLADMAIAPFVRQFAHTDKAWFDRQPWPQLHRWLADFLKSERFKAIFRKYPKWENGDPVTVFPEP